jgi:flagellar hook-associated protein 1 FlgK
MSTFSGLNTAYTGLNAARQGQDVVGQNITNATNKGYTRQRITTSSIPALAQVGALKFSSGVGQGVTVTGVDRIGDIYLDARVRSTAGTAGNLSVRADVLGTLEADLHEPGANGLSTQLQDFWSAWQAVSNQAGDAAPAGVLLQKAAMLTTRIASGYGQVDAQWTQTRSKLDGMVAQLNDAGARVADLNGRIRTTLAAGGSANELIDQRDALTTTIASLSGGTVRNLADGTAEVLVGGNALVSGDVFHAISVSGSQQLAGAGSSPVTLQWVDRPTIPVAVEAGQLAGAIAMLAPANGTGTGGSLAEAAQSYNALATSLASKVNAVHQGGATPSGATGLDFFAISATGPAALGLSVIPTSAAGIASGAIGAGGHDGSVADAIAKIGRATDSPDSVWATFVTRVGVSTRTAVQQADLAQLSATSATAAQLANSSVDMDEENVNLVAYQRAYQGAARVLTAVDEMLDVLINHTGIVGR